MKKLCKCGCGDPVRSNVQVYLAGHKPDDDAPAEESGPDETEDTNPDAAPEAYDLTLTLTLAQIDALWASLTYMQKATGLVAALQSRVDELL